MERVNFNETIHSINGPVITVKGKTSFSMGEMVYVGELHLIGEVIILESETPATVVRGKALGMD